MNDEKGEGVQKSHNFDDIIYGSPLLKQTECKNLQYSRVGPVASVDAHVFLECVELLDLAAAHLALVLPLGVVHGRVPRHQCLGGEGLLAHRATVLVGEVDLVVAGSGIQDASTALGPERLL